MSRIVMIEDDDGIAETLRYNLEAAGHHAWAARDGVTGLRLARSSAPDLILLDLILPGMDGIEVLRQVRRSSSTPVIMLTARDTEVDRVLGLELGADDYITKPFSVREALARIAAVLRRVGSPSVDLVSRPPGPEAFGNFVLDSAARRVTIDGRDVALALREFELLSFLVRHSEQVHTRSSLIQNVWDPTSAGIPGPSTSTSDGCERSSGAAHRLPSRRSAASGTGSTAWLPLRRKTGLLPKRLRRACRTAESRSQRCRPRDLVKTPRPQSFGKYVRRQVPS